MRTTFFLLAIALITLQAHAQQTPISLYEQAVPNSKTPPADYPKELDSSDRIKYVTQPTLIPYLPEKGTATGTSVLIFPGGGYFLLSMPACVEVAKALNKAGITAFIVKYRLPSDATMNDKSIGPLQDAQAAIKLVRTRAREWGLDPKKVGMMGLSAGGHLVSMLGTQLNRIVIDNKEHTDLRPDFMALLYPVIIYDPEVPRTRENLIGKNPSAQALDYYSTNKHVTPNTPPTFLVHAADDETIPVKNTLEFFTALLKSKVKAEMHILQSGDHGFALTDLNSGENWFNHFKSWLKENGF
ncbi:alpha/beta hydrolase [Pseudoflavitalea sp. G-6-1-2]|uniref:alpha/beta hydrolase n=1 Tax=Pseudoflavitalea sp. G-6-1-2 TaxID=2728841 RepID=UPI00146CA78A|nr:alpha/beta hydrolase [Pseudoflavitalea sp. G-6-1-2]NML22612.1 alpha/beta hydrolase [Pseudoflavitalea sp. G-6-1-2]